MTSPVLGLALLIGFVGQAVSQESPYLKSLISQAEMLKRSTEAEISKCEAAFAVEFKKIRDATLAEIETSRKEKMAADDLDGALALRQIAAEIAALDSTNWIAAKPGKPKRTSWEFANGNRLVKGADGRWVETADSSLVWDEKQRTDSCVTLYDAKRDVWARVYSDALFFQSANLRPDKRWELMEGKWIR